MTGDGAAAAGSAGPLLALVPGLSAVALAALAVAVLVRPPVRRVPVSRGDRPAPSPGALGRAMQGAALPVAAALAGAAVGGPVVGVLAAGGTVAWRLRRRRAREASARAARRAATVELCLALAAGLRAGAPPVAALVDAVEALPGQEGLRRVAAVAAAGGSPADELAAAAALPGGEGLRRVAACWTVAAGTGAGLAVALERVADGLRADEGVRRAVAAQLAGPRSTARMLAVLPLVGVAMGTLLGAAPLDVLLGSLPGLGCLAAGVALNVLGMAWTERIARAADPG
ncbi:type II secretion system F family protein [Motilibacter deserti]|uniref:Type II secretion system protein GspF domain-containing protein n=1 Tax=Motilibacter deserti TaxID=2714956 RepID=A0ABX0GZG3_9ACTN|nr:type II secretion system F family protein [Motilibacter deserti]NHC16406.1 hypothetical protein [Motilibacter deserti]